MTASAHEGLGPLVPQHHDPAINPLYRHRILCARLRKVRPEDLAPEWEAPGDLVGMTYWEAPPAARDTGGWSAAWPSMSLDVSQPPAAKTAAGKTLTRAQLAKEKHRERSYEIPSGVLHRADKADPRFRAERDSLPDLGHYSALSKPPEIGDGPWGIPLGWPGLVVGGVDEKQERRIFFPTHGPITAGHAVSRVQLNRAASQKVADLIEVKDPTDPTRRSAMVDSTFTAPVNSLMRVVHPRGNAAQAAQGFARPADPTVAVNYGPTPVVGFQNAGPGWGAVVGLTKERGQAREPLPPTQNKSPRLRRIVVANGNVYHDYGDSDPGASYVPKRSSPPKSVAKKPKDEPKATPPAATRTAVGYMSEAAGGPISMGEADDPHAWGASARGLSERPAKLSVNAIWHGHGGTGPLPFEDRKATDNLKRSPHRSPVHIVWGEGKPNPVRGPAEDYASIVGTWQLEAEVPFESRDDDSRVIGGGAGRKPPPPWPPPPWPWPPPPVVPKGQPLGAGVPERPLHEPTAGPKGTNPDETTTSEGDLDPLDGSGLGGASSVQPWDTAWHAMQGGVGGAAPEQTDNATAETAPEAPTFNAVGGQEPDRTGDGPPEVFTEVSAFLGDSVTFTPGPTAEIDDAGGQGTTVEDHVRNPPHAEYRDPNDRWQQGEDAPCIGRTPRTSYPTMTQTLRFAGGFIGQAQPAKVCQPDRTGWDGAVFEWVEEASKRAPQVSQTSFFGLGSSWLELGHESKNTRGAAGTPATGSGGSLTHPPSVRLDQVANNTVPQHVTDVSYVVYAPNVNSAGTSGGGTCVAFARPDPSTGGVKSGYTQEQDSNGHLVTDYLDGNGASAPESGVVRTKPVQEWDNHVIANEVSAPGAPSNSGETNFYFRDSRVFIHPNGGSEIDLTAGGSGGNTSQIIANGTLPFLRGPNGTLQARREGATTPVLGVTGIFAGGTGETLDGTGSKNEFDTARGMKLTYTTGSSLNDDAAYRTAYFASVDDNAGTDSEPIVQCHFAVNDWGTFTTDPNFWCGLNTTDGDDPVVDPDASDSSICVGIKCEDGDTNYQWLMGDDDGASPTEYDTGVSVGTEVIMEIVWTDRSTAVGRLYDTSLSLLDEQSFTGLTTITGISPVRFEIAMRRKDSDGSTGPSFDLWRAQAQLGAWG